MPSFAKTYKFNNMKKILQVTILFSLLTVGSFAQKQQQILPADQEIPLKYGADRLQLKLFKFTPDNGSTPITC